MKRHRISIPYVTDQVLRNTSDVVDPNDTVDQLISDDVVNPKQDLKEFLDSRELNYRTRASLASSYDDDDWADSIVDLSQRPHNKMEESSLHDDKAIKQATQLNTDYNQLRSPNANSIGGQSVIKDVSSERKPPVNQIPEDQQIYPSQMYPLLEVPESYHSLIPKLQFFFKYYGLYEDSDYVVDKDNQGYYFYPTKKWTTRDQKELMDNISKGVDHDDNLLDLEEKTSDNLFEENLNVHQLVDFVTKGFYVEKRNIKGKYYFDINNPSLNINKIANVDCQDKILSAKEKIDMIFKASGIYRAMKLKAKW
ncbi:phosphoprotein P [Tibrogargan virus]|uniref:Phosphoprotein n=1 Tax=Tibrogargan virus (strain CS132) TaxID=1559361 RepID=PHOSP_TIBVC|nr:phosphoprotein P [Tibrogargan virus]D8V071.1 RecName: Full=Phosphoprotein; Short=P protein [Tibrogargan virus strain CS132]ADG86348.1 phosphoprotein P [Tibrogargan virus]